jgi:carboxylate-amine ligase
LIASGGLPDPSFLWWDVRLQPALGTVEVRVMDAQSTLTDTAALIALVQSLARLVVEGEAIGEDVGPEVLAENRFLAARDGLQARLIDPEKGALTPVRALIEQLLTRCRPHAAALGCSSELDSVEQLADANGAVRQRVWAEEAGLTGLMSTLTACFPAGRESLGEPARRVGR